MTNSSTSSSSTFGTSIIVISGAALLVGVAASIAATIHNKKKTYKPIVTINLPDWLYEYYHNLKDVNYTTDEEMVQVAIDISSKNVTNGTGGPFGCAIFQRTVVTKNSVPATPIIKLFSVGANRVTILNNSTLHGEMVAIQFAQFKLQNYSLKPVVSTETTAVTDDTTTTIVTTTDYILATSCEPCCMCLGGTLWSGVSELLCAATKNDAESIGFNEGPVFDPESYNALKEQGIVVKKKILQQDAANVLIQYAKNGVMY